MRHVPLALVLAGCAASAADTQPTSHEPEVTIVYAGAAQKSGLVATPLEVPLVRAPTGPSGELWDALDGVQARQAFTRSAAEHGAHYVSDLEFHIAVHDETDFECVVLMQTVPVDQLPAAEPPDQVTLELSREVNQPYGRVDRGRSCASGPAYYTVAGGRACQEAEGVLTLRLPYWAANAGFLPVFVDPEHPPESGRWRLFVSAPRCHPVATALPSSFVRGTIYTPPPPAATKGM